MKIHIFGASGSGVTTLGRALSAICGFPYIDSDDFFWAPSEPPFTLKREITERNTLLENEVHTLNNWILGGSIVNWTGLRIENFDLVVFLYLPPEVRIERLRKREFERYGEVILRDPIRRKFHEEFIAWAADYDAATGIAGRTLHAHESWLQTLDCPIVEIRGDTSVEERIARILEHLPSVNTESIMKK